MLCDICKKNDATVHVTKIINGYKQDINLCEKCAKEKGELNFVPQIEFVSSFGFQNILSGIMDYMSNANNEQYKSFDICCKNCNTSYSEFKKIGLVGCSECYKNFSNILEPIIKRVQANSDHTGKVPKKTGKNIIERKNLLKLKEELQKAISLEEYEKAATIRDRIKQLKKQIYLNEDSKKEE
ncbi:UvrB/UvrC motif-containing protein [Clostridium sp. WILCCON 0269]|uniref:UvrB/UvrC motif-containing protein n=1 Tax=Candidatus Clostridium eludens TaxID=3381663 RepID=A0ABW8SKI1_9CLOT